MATNDFQSFAGGVGANVLSQSDWLALAALGAGFSSGVAPSAACNKAWRQSSIMSAVVAQMIVDNTGQNATDDGTTATLLANLKKAVGGRLINVQVFNSSGTYTPTPGTNSVVVEGVGGGGAGGGTPTTTSAQATGGGGGASGSYFKTRLTTGFNGVTVTIGAGGVGSAGSAGGNGGQTSFGAIATAAGGTGGTAGSVAGTFPQINGYGLPGAIATGGTITNAAGSAGSPAFTLSIAAGLSGTGGSSVYGGGGKATITTTAVGSAGAAPGAGGSGAMALASSASTLAGGGGAGGQVLVWEYA